MPVKESQREDWYENRRILRRVSPNKKCSSRDKHNRDNSQRYRYRQISSQRQNNLSNSKDRVNKFSSPQTFSSGLNDSIDDKSEISAANATIVTYESWDSMAMFQPTQYSPKLKTKNDNNNNSFKENNFGNQKQQRHQSSNKNGKRSHNYDSSRVEHYTIKKWLCLNEMNNFTSQGQNQLKNIQLRISNSTMPSTSSQNDVNSHSQSSSGKKYHNNFNVNKCDDSYKRDYLVPNIGQNMKKLNEKCSILSIRKKLKTDSKLINDELVKVNEKCKKICNNLGFTSIAKNLRLNYLRATGRAAKNGHKIISDITNGKFNEYFFGPKLSVLQANYILFK